MGIDKVSPPSRPLAASLPRIGSKSVLAGVVAAIAASASPSAFAEIELGEGLSVSGFVDMSIYSLDVDGSPTSENAGIDQAELDFMWAGADGISAQVDFELADGSDQGNDTNLEQAFITKKFNDQFSMKMGRFLSYSGWEAQEPTGLYQYSAILGGYQQNFYGYYQNGVSAYYDGGMFDLMGSIVTDTFDPTDTSLEEIGYEVGVALTPMEGLTAKLFYISNTTEGATDETSIVNAWLSYTTGGFTFAGEYSTADVAGGGDYDGFMVMGNYTSGPWGITGRYHSHGPDGDDITGFTIAPSYKASDNLLIVAEFRTDDIAGTDATQIALEALFTF